MTSYDVLLDRIITDGIAEIRSAAAYADPKDHHKRDGAIEGFEACRGKSPNEIVALWTEAESATTQDMRSGNMSVLSYWRQRYKALQIEWVCNIISVGLVNNGLAPLLGHLPTARGMAKYVSIVGVRTPDNQGVGTSH